MEINERFSLLSHLDNYSDETTLRTLEISLPAITLLLKEENNKNSLREEDWQRLNSLVIGVNEEAKRQINSRLIKVYCEIFRVLRNACAASPRNQGYILTTPNLFEELCSAFQLISSAFQEVKESERKDEYCLGLKCCLQFFANSVTGSAEETVNCKLRVWETFSSNDTFRTFINEEDPTVALLTGAILYNCLLNEPLRKQVIKSGCTDIVEAILINLSQESATEWNLWSLQKLLETEHFLPAIMMQLSPKARLILLDAMVETITNENVESEGQRAESHSIEETNMRFVCSLLADNLVNIVNCEGEPEVLSRDGQTTEQEVGPLQVRKLLSLWCEVSSSPTNGYLAQIDGQNTLIVAALDSLKSLHLLGKSDSPAFSSAFKPVPSLKQRAALSEEDIELSVVFALKRDLIRLIGNLSYRNERVQDQVARMDGIPLLLDSCNIDARNPYIVQWVIFAVTNLLENNAANQSIVAGLAAHGILVDSPLLKEMGLKIKDGKVVNLT